MTTSQSDDFDALKQSLIKLATIANQLDARSAQATRQVEASADALDLSVSRLESGAARFAKEALQLIGEQARQTVAQGVAQALGEFNAQLQTSTHAAQRAAQGMEEQRKGLNHVQRVLVWKGLAALVIGSILAAGGSGFIAWKSMREIRRAEFGQDILRASQNGVLTRCDGTLCAKVGDQAARYGKNDEYVLLAE